jgi:hypothetical protein
VVSRSAGAPRTKWPRDVSYLYKIDEEELFAYTNGRRDYFRAGDDSLWAHESHNWLVAAKSGVVLAHRTGDRYYSVTDGECLYRITTDPLPQHERRASGSSERLRVL